MPIRYWKVFPDKTVERKKQQACTNSSASSNRMTVISKYYLLSIAFLLNAAATPHALAQPSLAGITGKPDISFTTYLSTKKTNPETSMLPAMSFPNAPHCFCMFEPWFTPTVGYIDAFLKKVFTQ